MDNKFKKSIVSFMLCFFMLFTNIVSTFAYEWDLEVPPIINGSDVTINGGTNDLNNKVVINGNNDITTNNNNNININNSNNSISNIENNKVTNTVQEQNILTKNGRTVKAKIEPVYKNLTRAGKQIFTLYCRDKGMDASVSFRGDEPGADDHSLIDYITRHNGDNNSVGYCVSPFYAGAKENKITTVEETTMTANDKKLIGIAVAGYPHNKYNVKGYDDLDEQDQYYATKIAMEHFIFQQKNGEYRKRIDVQFNGDHWNSTRWFPSPKVSSAQKQNAQKIIDVAKQIYEKGMANPYDPDKGIATITFTDNNKNNGEMEIDGDNYILTIDINSDINYSHALIQFTDPIVKQWATSTTTKIQFYDGDKNGTRLYFQTHPIAGENYEGIAIKKASRKSDKLTIVLDKETANKLITGDTGSHTLDYDVKFFGGNMQVGYRTKNVDNTLQDYAVITTGNATARSSINWKKTTFPTTTPDPGKGGLKILKYNAKTNELVKGAIFKIRGISNDVYDFNVDIQASAGSQIPILNNGATVTVEDGVITIENLEVGTYEITEITPPPNFDLALGQNSQTVQVESETNTTLYPQVRFENNPYGSLKIKKVDAVTGEALAGAVIKISNPLFDYEQEFTTNAQGLIEISDLKQGTYEITEVQAPNGYVLSKEVKTATLKWGETTEITYENQPKTSLKITKIDSETGEKLDGARFKLKHTTSGAEYVTETNANGIATIENLVAGTYELIEIQAPNGYILNNTPQNVVIENNRVNEVV
ncbi:MAG: hypothetical protein K2L15_04090, partial [Eubacteriales bacterium]|nr:hypothetical protein [Eubacteriales bacterium]